MTLSFNYEGKTVDLWEDVTFIPRIGEHVLLNDGSVKYEITGIIWYGRNFVDVAVDNWEFN